MRSQAARGRWEREFLRRTEAMRVHAKHEGRPLIMGMTPETLRVWNTYATKGSQAGCRAATRYRPVRPVGEAPSWLRELAAPDWVMGR